jgi:transcriptional regulator with XRE-family HTH domain
MSPVVEITGGMLRAARSLTGLSQQELAERASGYAKGEARQCALRPPRIVTACVA